MRPKAEMSAEGAARRAEEEADQEAARALPGRVSARSRIDPFIVMDVMRKANEATAAGRDIIHMEVGQPATRAPRAALERAARALKEDRLGYVEALGLPALRERIAKFYGERYGLALSPERVIVTAGSSAAFLLAFLAILEPGERFGLPSPGYPCYRHILAALSGRPELVETCAEDRFMPSPADVAELAAKDAKGLLLASPNNPTGTMAIEGRLAALANACRSHGLWLVSDEIYHGLDYEHPSETALAAWDQAVVINSFSKYFSMTGWRIGWMVVPDALVRPIERLSQNLFISTPAISQIAALGAFDGIEELEATKAVYAANRALLLNELPAAGVDRLLPADGAFYLYADVSRYTDDAAAFCTRMLDEAGIATTPGIDFDPVRGRYFVRFSYAGAPGEMREAARRLKAWMRG